MNTLGIITARGGSKSIPRKNIVMLAGKPLITWTIEEAKKSRLLSRFILSSDDLEICTVAKKAGCEVPFVRPGEFAQDDSPTIDVFLHALNWLKEKEGWLPEYVVLLQPTSPLRVASDIDGAIELALTRRAQAVITLCQANPHPYLSRTISVEGLVNEFFENRTKATRRQDYPAAYIINGAVKVNRVTSLVTSKNFQPHDTLAYIMPVERSLDVDTPYDLRVAELLLKEREYDRM